MEDEGCPVDRLRFSRMHSFLGSREGLPSPEDPVVTEDAVVFGRNYFDRPLAPEVESLEEANKLACKTDGACFGHNYFNRPSAPETEDVEEANERAQILADALALKKSAVNYMNPEVGVTVEDSTVFGHNYEPCLCS
ncbi:hypothetical protein ACHAWO_013284 [Cyclotella atomus]|uniref:Uncharacterized protein n=1 Tax=Cyclotella atomus TaxID=382360 RepID=A0ABD3PG52_9STRA